MKQEDSTKLTKALSFIRRITPEPVFRFLQPYYHSLLPLIGAIIFRFPAKKLKVFLVTGTKGKTSTTEILYSIFSEAGYKTALLNGLRFNTGDNEYENRYIMSVPGRFFVQRFLYESFKSGCTHAVVEMTSEGARFFRHKLTYPNALIVNKITPEHIESHGSFNNYIEAKLRIRDELVRSSKKNKILVLNQEDQLYKYFAVSGPTIRTVYHLPSEFSVTDPNKKISFKLEDRVFKSKLRGSGNLENVLAASTLALEFGVDADAIQSALDKLTSIHRRNEDVPNDKNIKVVLDYAHTPESAKQLYEIYKDKAIVCVFGSAGGGRDASKRKKLGELAFKYCKHIVLTEEDPYWESPREIIRDIEQGIPEGASKEMVLDREKAIRYALQYAKKMKRKKPVVLILGMSAPYMVKEGKKIPWDDKKIVKDELASL